MSINNTGSTTQAVSFSDLPISDKLKSILKAKGFTVPTPIQVQAIPPAVAGTDVVGIAQTGTGKTLAFSLPMLERIAKVKGKGLILTPTRELAVQINQTLEKVGTDIGLKTAVLIGGENIRKQVVQIRKGAHIFVATPGRLIDFLNQKIIKLSDITVCVLDEADRMLDMGFAPQINTILDQITSEHQTMLFSATMPDEIMTIAARHMKTPVRIEVAPPGTTSKNVAQEILVVEKSKKINTLLAILKEHPGKSSLIFTRTKFGAKNLAKALARIGVNSAEIHSNRSLSQRIAALEGFKKGKIQSLVATDIMARGIDVNGIGIVVNFDLPATSDDYVHRIGRTGRAGMLGLAVTFASPDQLGEVARFERQIKYRIPRGKLDQSQISSVAPENSGYTEREDRPYRGGGNSRGGQRSFAPRQDRFQRSSSPSRPGPGKPYKKSFREESSDPIFSEEVLGVKRMIIPAFGTKRRKFESKGQMFGPEAHDSFKQPVAQSTESKKRSRSKSRFEMSKPAPTLNKPPVTVKPMWLTRRSGSDE